MGSHCKLMRGATPAGPRRGQKCEGRGQGVFFLYWVYVPAIRANPPMKMTRRAGQFPDRHRRARQRPPRDGHLAVLCPRSPVHGRNPIAMRTCFPSNQPADRVGGLFRSWFCCRWGAIVRIESRWLPSIVLCIRHAGGGVKKGSNYRF